MRKLIFVLVLTAVLFGFGGNAFAVELPGVAPEGNNPLNAVHLDTTWLVNGLINRTFGIGAAYERAVLPFLALKVTGGFVFIPGITYINILGGVRGYFLQGAVNGPFVGASAGVQLAAFGFGSAVGFEMLFEGGYKFTLMNGGEGGFFAEPVVALLVIPGGVLRTAYFLFGANLGWSF